MTQLKPQLLSTVAAHVDRFTGRAWLLPKLLDWLERPDQRILLLTGGPGTGKSMIAAWLAGYGPAPADPVAAEQLERLRSQLPAAHFCMAASRSNSPQAFAESIANQLTANVPGFGDALAATLAERVQIVVTQQIATAQASVTGVSIGHIDLGNLGDELSFDRAFTEPVRKLYAAGYDKPLLILVDALDEALTYTGAITLVHVLAGLADLPPQVRILATARPDPRVLKYFRAARLLDLIKDAPPDVDDVRAYTAQRLAAIAPALDAPVAAGLAGRISAAAQGIFLYAALVLEEWGARLAQDPTLDLDTLALPAGLSGLYYDFLNRELGRDEDRWYESFRPVLGLIAVAQGDGLARAQLAAITKRDVEGALRVCKQYLAGDLPEGPFRLFHKSFADFLLEDDANLDYRIDAPAMNRQIADFYWQIYGVDWLRCDSYGLASLAVHLAEGGQHERLALLIGPSWMLARFRGADLDYRGFLADVDMAWQTAIEEEEGDRAAGRAMTTWARQVRYGLIGATARSESYAMPPELVAQLVAAGLWLPGRALAVAAAQPDDGARAEAYRLLLATGKLDEEQTARARLAWQASQPAAVETVAPAPELAALEGALRQFLAGDYDSSEFWLPAIGQLRLPPLEEALAQVLAPVPVELALRIPPSASLIVQRRQAYQAILARALTLAFTPHLADQAMDRALSLALGLSEPARRREAAWAVARQAPYMDRTQLMAALAGLAEQQDDGAARMALLAALAPQLTDERQAQAVLRASDLVAAGTYDRLAWVSLFPWLAPEARQPAVQQIVADADAGLIAAAVGWMDDELRGRAVSRAWDRALDTEEPALWAPVLVTLAGCMDAGTLLHGLQISPWRDSQAREPILAQLESAPTEAARRDAQTAALLEVALALWRPNLVAQAVTRLAPALSQSQVQRAWAGVDQVASPQHRCQAQIALAAAAPQVAPSTFLTSALEMALGESDEPQAELLGILARYHPDWFRDQGGAVRPALVALLRRAAAANRQRLLERLRQLMPAWQALAPDEAASQVADAVVEVCYEWKWG